MKYWGLLLLLIIFVFNTPFLANPQEEISNRLMVSITIDDLPWSGATAPEETRLISIERLLATLKRYKITATGFVNCGNASRSDPILQKWLDSGMELGNHTFGHLDLNRIDVDKWIDDVETCHRFLTTLQGHPPRYFRYPYLHEGDTTEKLTKASSGIKRLGYENGIVTIDNSDFLLAYYYGLAVEKKNSVLAYEIADAYVDHLVDALNHFDQLADDAFGSSIPQILLLHANLIAADHLERVLKEYSKRGVTFVDLETALKHPIFSRETNYVGRKGLSWIYRSSPETFKKSGDWDDAQVNSIRSRFGHLEN
jgi:peptidoglycan/xylan/chitin deacetylase (PgdA/CDA1 family)